MVCESRAIFVKEAMTRSAPRSFLGFVLAETICLSRLSGNYLESLYKFRDEWFEVYDEDFASWKSAKTPWHSCHARVGLPAWLVRPHGVGPNEGCVNGCEPI